MKKTKRLFQILIVLAVLLCMTACADLTTSVSFSEDGSVTLETCAYISETFIKYMGMTPEQYFADNISAGDKLLTKTIEGNTYYATEGNKEKVSFETIDEMISAMNNREPLAGTWNVQKYEDHGRTVVQFNRTMSSERDEAEAKGTTSKDPLVKVLVDEVTIYSPGGIAFVNNVERSDYTVTDNNRVYALLRHYTDYEYTAQFAVYLPKAAGKEIRHLDFTLDVPNDGEKFPDGAADTGRVTGVPEGVKVTDIESVMYGSRMNNTAYNGNEVTFGIYFELQDGWELADDCEATVNGKAAEMTFGPEGVCKVTLDTSIIYNPDIDILTDLPDTVRFPAGGILEAKVKANGQGLRYQWQLGTRGSGPKQKVVFEDIDGAYSPSFIVINADESYAGKYLRCIISNGEGNAMSAAAVLEMVDAAHVHAYAPNHDDLYHWEVCSCGDIQNKRSHTLIQKSDASGHWSECECGYKTEKEAHKFGDWTVTKAATEKEEGLQERVCSVCGYKEEKKIAKVGAAELTTPFVDVPKDAYYYDATVWAYNAEPQITDGNGKDKFMPEQICTRGQVVTFLWRSAGQPAPAKTANPFVDVAESDYFYQPVLWAFYNDTQITDGTDATHFSPANPCKNSHILTFIWRALGEPGKTADAATWYTDAYNWAKYDADLLTGTFEGTYDVNAQCPRKNVVQYLYRYYTMADK